MNLPDAASTQGLLALLEKSAAAGCWTLEFATWRWTWTEALYGLLELSPQEHSPLDGLDLLTPASQAAVQAAWLACRLDARPFELELQATTATGRHLWLHACSQAVRSAHGEVLGLQGTLRDISAPKRSEQACLRLQEQLSTTLASITEAFATLNREGRFTYVNPESERLLGHTSVQLLGHPMGDVLEDSGTARLQRTLESALASGSNTEIETYCLFTRQQSIDQAAYLTFGSWKYEITRSGVF